MYDTCGIVNNKLNVKSEKNKIHPNVTLFYSRKEQNAVQTPPTTKMLCFDTGGNSMPYAGVMYGTGTARLRNGNIHRE